MPHEVRRTWRFDHSGTDGTLGIAILRSFEVFPDGVLRFSEKKYIQSRILNNLIISNYLR